MLHLTDLIAGEPGRVALIEAATDRRVTRGELVDAVGLVGARLREQVGGGVAFVYVANRAADVVGWLAVAAAGGASVLLDAGLDDAAAQALERRYRPDVVLGRPPADAEATGAWRTDGAAGLTWWSTTGAAGEAVHPDLALCLSTSGSTGSPKLVRLSTTNVVHNSNAIVEALGIDDGEVAFAHLPLHYSYGLSVLHSHLAAGSAVVLSTESALRPGFWEQLHAHAVTTLPHVPYGYQMLERAGLLERDLPALRVLTQAGGRLDAERAERLHGGITARGGRFVVMYGQTEATARLSVLPSERFHDWPGSVGVAVPGGSFEVVDGEVVYRGPNVMLGYAHDRADLARGDELGGVLHTGDEGRLDGDVLTITGRRSRLAKVFGLRFGLDEVEALAAAASPVEGATVVAVGGDDVIVLYPEACGPEQCQALARAVARALRLPAAGVRAVPVGELPRTAAGKVAYAELPGAS